MQKVVDFIHVGYHKTGSTWLQLVGFQKHPEIELINKPGSNIEKFFYDNFWRADDFDFNPKKFRQAFSKLIETSFTFNQAQVRGISEENLTGHVYTGQNAKVLADRIYETFGKVKVIIVVRNQIGMITSLYNNYIQHGGSLSLSAFCKDLNIPGWLIFRKLQYDKLIQYYFNLFGKEQVKVMLYEEMSQDLDKFMNDMFSFIGVKPYSFKNWNCKINPALSPVSLRLARFANAIFAKKVKIFHLGLRLFDEWIYYKIGRETSATRLALELSDQFRESNRRLEKLLDRELGIYGYPV